MKTLLSVLLILFCLFEAHADRISIEEFKKTDDPDERQKMIDAASPEQQAELKTINLHLSLLKLFGGETELKDARELQVAKERGLGAFETMFIRHLGYWEIYWGQIEETKADKTLTPREIREKGWKKLEEAIAPLKARIKEVHLLAFNIAASPRALALAKRAKDLGFDLRGQASADSSNRYFPETKEGWEEANKQADEIFEEMKHLPKLPPEEVQKEFDAFTDDKVRPYSFE